MSLRRRIFVFRPAEKKGEVGDVEDWFPAPLVHQLAECEGVDNGAHVRGRDHPRTADFLEGRPVRKSRKRSRKGLHLSTATGVGPTGSRCNSGGSC